MSFWDAIASVFGSTRQHLVEHTIAADRTDRPAAATVESEKHYFRVTLAQMYLRKESGFLITYFPAVHGVVSLLFDGKPLDIPNAADASRLTLRQDGRGDVIAKNFALSPLVPFKGDVVKLALSLHAVEGQNQLREFLGTLGEFAKLVAVPQLSAVVDLAAPLATGLQKLFGQVDGEAHLVYANTFAGAGSGGRLLQGGYTAVIRAPQGSVDTSRLWVVNQELREGPSLASATAYTDHDYMLLHVDVREDRDDFNELPAIKQAMAGALDAAAAGDDTKADAHYRIALAAAMRAPELTRADRRRVVSLLKEEFAEAANATRTSGLARGSANYDLQQRWYQQTMSVDEALALGEPTFDELFGAGG